jgi:integrative and conjugative element protein (TIGR02256 family)
VAYRTHGLSVQPVEAQTSHDSGVEGDGSIEIGRETRANIMRMASESEDGLETGGILLGRGPDANGVVQVEIAGDAGPRAERRRDFFLRDLVHARSLAEEAWATSRSIWVGEWHTHPLGGRAPSPSDIRTYVSLLATAELEFEIFTAIIVTPGFQGNWRQPQLWPWLLHLADRQPPQH